MLWRNGKKKMDCMETDSIRKGAETANWKFCSFFLLKYSERHLQKTVTNRHLRKEKRNLNGQRIKWGRYAYSGL